jgi:hypothetical protein
MKNNEIPRQQNERFLHLLMEIVTPEGENDFFDEDDFDPFVFELDDPSIIDIWDGWSYPDEDTVLHNPQAVSDFVFNSKQR